MLTVPIPLPLASLVPAVELFTHPSILHGQAHVSRVMVHAFRLPTSILAAFGTLDADLWLVEPCPSTFRALARF
jgi:hypothetical protein